MQETEYLAFQPEADRSHQILGFYHKSFSLVAHLAVILEFWTPSKETFPKMYTPPPPHKSSLLKFGPNI